MSAWAGRIILLWGWRQAGLAFLAGAIAVLALPPFDFIAAALVSFALLLLLLEGAIPKPHAGFFGQLMPAMKVGWWFGFGYFIAGLWWLGNALLAESEEFAWAIPLAVLALPALLALFYALAAGLARIIWSEGIGSVAALGFGFGVAEWLRTFLFTGFPWNPVGHLAMPMPLLMQSASVVGVEGMNILAVIFFSLPALILLGKHRKTAAFLFLLMAGLHAGFGYYQLNLIEQPRATSVSARLVQPSVDQSEKWDDAARDKIFAKLIELSAQPPAAGAARPSLIIWPETAVPFLLTDRPDAYTAIGNMLQDGQMLLTGAVRQEGKRESGDQVRYYNSLLLIGDDGVLVSASDKEHLVPFGEYLPAADFLESLGLTQIVTTPGGFSSGGPRKNISIPGKLKINPLICYEVIFPRATRASDGRADVMVNVTNDAWYGRTPGPYQHLRSAQLRSVEQGVPLLRVANNGVSAAIDARGRIMDALALDAIATIDISVPAAIQPTPYVRHGGLIIPIALLLCIAIASLTILRARSRMSRTISA
jgi:apolipoprotein N-acyltransferase